MTPTMLIVYKVLTIFAGLIGVMGHWAVRWYQKRTTSDFWVYLKGNAGATFASLSANLATGIGITSMIATNLTFEQVLGYIGLAYTQGFAWDSHLNKDSGTPTVEHDDKESSLDELLADDRKL